MNSDYAHELSFAKRVAQQANEIAMSHYKTELRYATKADRTPVTIADEEINRMVVKTVQEAFPNDGVLGEEESWQLDKKRLWVCDPIDGTTSFSIGMPTFMFALALVDDGTPLLAVASNPVTGDLFWAVKGKGAFLQDSPISASNRNVSESWMLYTADLKSLCKNQNLYQHIEDTVYQTNIVHGSVYKGVLIAQGLADASIHFQSGKPWDFAAVSLLITEAGGSVSDAQGKELRFDQKLQSVISTNGVIHTEILKMLNNPKLQGQL